MIIFEDYEEFQRIYSMNNLNISHRFEFSFYERIETMDKEPTLADIAAVYGSLKIFKFLWMQNKFVADDDLLYYAYFGGNFDIIHICEEKCSELFVCRQPVFAHRYDLLNYYLDKYDDIFEEKNIKEKLVNFQLDENNETNNDDDDDEYLDLYQKLNYDALVFALRGFNYVIVKKCFAKICFLVKFYDFENLDFILLGHNSYTLINSCIYDIDMYKFMFSLRNESSEVFNNENF